MTWKQECKEDARTRLYQKCSRLPLKSSRASFTLTIFWSSLLVFASLLSTADGFIFPRIQSAPMGRHSALSNRIYFHDEYCQKSRGSRQRAVLTCLNSHDSSASLFSRSSAGYINDDRKQKSPILRLHSMKIRVALILGFTTFCFVPHAVARTTLIESTSTLWQRAVSTIIRTKNVLPWKTILSGVMAVWGGSLVYSNNQVKKRQAIMATSEWSRYAKYPSARGRAIVWLMIRQASFVLASRIIRSKRSEIRKRAGRHFADSLLRLGPLYIKMGQIISCRKNLLGPEWIDAMSTLQDNVPANTGQDAMELAYTTLDGGKKDFDEIFSDFDSTPLAAASLGQVHKGTLRSNGDTVAVKIQRPYLRKIYDQDMDFLTTIARWMDKMPSASKNVGGVASSWTGIFEDAGEILYREIDYRDEAENGVRIANDFGLTRGGEPIESQARARNNETLPSAADWIRIPYVYQNISNERILVMEFVSSMKVTDDAKLKAANVTQMDKIDLADALARAYLRQFCCNLFFSTDPHPGNVGIEIAPNSGKPRLVLYDFGQAASLTKNQADGILQILEAIVDMDVEGSIEAFQKMGVLVDGADLDKVRAKVSENYKTGKVKANRNRLKRKGYKFKKDDAFTTSNGPSDGNTTKKDTNISTKSQRNNADNEVMSFFTLPAEYAFVARAISQMDGVGKTLDPDFDFVSNSAPYIFEIKGADQYVKEQVVKFFDEWPDRLAKWQTETIPEMYDQWLAKRRKN